MRTEQALMELEGRIASCTAFITYTPFGNETNPNTAPLPFLSHAKRIMIPQDAQTNPNELAQRIVDNYRDENVCILVPGQLFDAHGTRHGRGGGWYDKFLSRVSTQWVRIGITSSTHFSTERIVRHSWDEPMDIVYVYDVDTRIWEKYPAKKPRFKKRT